MPQHSVKLLGVKKQCATTEYVTTKGVITEGITTQDSTREGVTTNCVPI
jgi:hypothetical protein